MRLFNDINSVGAVFDAGDAMDAATVWFSADPSPQGLYIGRWATTDVATTLHGGTPTEAAGSSPLDAANAAFSLGGNDVTADLSAAATYADIATAFQAAIQAVGGIFAGATFVYDTNDFLLSLTGSDPISPPYFGTPTTGTDVSEALGMNQAAMLVYRRGHDAEGIANALTELVTLTASPPVAIMLAGDAPLVDPVATGDTRENAAAWAEAGDYVFAQRDTVAQALVTNDMTSVSALAISRNQGQVAATFDNADARPDVGLMALMSSQNLDNIASIITAHAKAIPRRGGVHNHPLPNTKSWNASGSTS